MRYSLEEVFQQSMDDKYSADLSSKCCKSRIVYGIKSIMDRETFDIIIYNTAKGGDYYREVEEDEYNIFFEKGWRYGVYSLSLDNIRLKLDKIEAHIKDEVNGGLSKKAILEWKVERSILMTRYSKVSKKFNKLKSK